MTPDIEHRFGGPWTDEKLQVVLKYLGFYTAALGGKFGKLIYIDAFAGTGSREFDDEAGETQSSDGSALRAIQVEPSFDEYIFIEKDPEKALELGRNLLSRSGRNARVICGDANDELLKLLQSWNKYSNRGVVFLDPFAMHVNWTVLQAIARTEGLDLWLLFPFGAVARTMPREGGVPPEWVEKLVHLLGEDPRPYFYETQVQTSLFPEEIEFALDDERQIRRGGTRMLGSYLVRRLKSVFKGFVSSQALVLRNSKNSPMFLLMFCSANPDEKAVALANKAAESILNKHGREGGDVQRFSD